SAGFGPGAGRFPEADGAFHGASAGYGTGGMSYASNPELAGLAYGNASIMPLIGGSGGAGGKSTHAWGGCGGGGAILIAAESTVTITGVLTASGGNSGGGGVTRGGGGSGGAIRIVGDVIQGDGIKRANGGDG